MKNEKLAKLFSKVKERLESKAPSYSRIQVGAPKVMQKASPEVKKGSKVKHAEHGVGEVKAILHGGQYASVHFKGEQGDGHYKPVKVSDLSPHSESKGKLAKFMAKARVDEGLSIKDKQEAREARQWRTPHWVGSDPKAKIPAEIPHENYTNKEGKLRGMKRRHDGNPKWDPAHAQSDGLLSIDNAAKGVHHRGEYLQGAKSTHQKKLAELKEMPKPNLPKSEMGKSEDGERKQYHVSFKSHEPKKEFSKSKGWAQYHLSKKDLHHILSNWDHEAKFEPKGSQPKGKSKKGGFHATTRQRPTAGSPMKRYLKKAPDSDKKKKILYDGIGQDEAGRKALSRGGKHHVVGYDPHHADKKMTKLPLGKYDEVHSQYTLNVIPKEKAKEVMQRIHDRMKDNGKAIISVRRDFDNKKMHKAEEDKVEEMSDQESPLMKLKGLIAKKEAKKMSKASPENMTSAQLQGLKVPQPKPPKMTQKPIQNRPVMPKPKMGGAPKMAGMAPKMKVGK